MIRVKNFLMVNNFSGGKMGNKQKKFIKKFFLHIQNGGDDIQKWVNLSNFWKILALGI